MFSLHLNDPWLAILSGLFRSLQDKRSSCRCYSFFFFTKLERFSYCYSLKYLNKPLNSNQHIYSQIEQEVISFSVLHLWVTLVLGHKYLEHIFNKLIFFLWLSLRISARWWSYKHTASVFSFVQVAAFPLLCPWIILWLRMFRWKFLLNFLFITLVPNTSADHSSFRKIKSLDWIGGKNE